MFCYIFKSTYTKNDFYFLVYIWRLRWLQNILSSFPLPNSYLWGARDSREWVCRSMSHKWFLVICNLSKFASFMQPMTLIFVQVLVCINNLLFYGRILFRFIDIPHFRFFIHPMKDIWALSSFGWFWRELLPYSSTSSIRNLFQHKFSFFYDKCPCVGWQDYMVSVH